MAVNRRSTIADIARALGLSKGAVSYALNGRPGVSDETRARVLQTAESMGWKPNVAARSLSGSATGTVGVILARTTASLEAENFFASCLAGIEQCLDDVDGAVLFRLTTGPGHDVELTRQWCETRRVDGFLLFDELLDDPRPAVLAGLGVPGVVTGGGPRLPDTPPVPRLVNTQEDEARTILEHLRRLGHRSVLHLAGPAHYRHESLRAGWIRAVAAERGMTVVRRATDYGREAGLRTATRVLRARHDVSAVVAANDLVALGALEAIARERDPDEVALVSWHDSPMCEAVAPAVTALATRPSEMARVATEMLLSAVESGSVADAVSPSAELTVRGTSVPRFIPSDACN